MNMKINTICFIILLFLLLGVASAAENDNETLHQTIKQPDEDTYQASLENKDKPDEDTYQASLENKDKPKIGIANTETMKASTPKLVTLGSLTAGKIKVKIKAPNVNMHYKDGSKFTVTLKDKYNLVLKKAKVKITIDGQTYTKTTDSKGKAYLNLNLKSGKYAVTTTFDATDFYKKASVKSTVTIKSTLKCKDYSKYYKNKGKYSATFYTQKGKLLKETSVKFKLNGKTYTVKTNKKGVAKLEINLKPGKYSISSTNPKTSETITKTVTVKSILETGDLTMTENDGSKFTVKVLNSNGKACPNKKVTIKVNGKTYTPKSNSQGIATQKIDLPAGKYSVTVEYEGLKNTNQITVNEGIKHTPFSHVISIPNYVNITYPYVFQNSAYSLKSGTDGIIRMPKNEVFAVQISEDKGYLFSQASIQGLDTTVIGYKTHLIPFDGGEIQSEYNKDKLKGDGILIYTTTNHTNIEFRNTCEYNTDLFGVYMDKGIDHTETITYIQNDRIRAMIDICTVGFDEMGLKYTLGKYHGKSIYDFNYKSYEDLIGNNVNNIKFANTGEPVTFSYFGKSIVGYESREDITTRFIVNGREELVKSESISYGLDERYRSNLGFEALQSYVIINERVTEDIIKRWVIINPGYLIRMGITNVYGMFLAGLETAWLSDEIADANAKDFNVKWKRNTTLTILGGTNLDDTYLHILNADMGMGVTGNNDNIGLFRMINSLNLPNIEEYVLEPVSKRFGYNSTNSLNNVFSSANNFSTAQLGEMLYVFNNNDSAIVLNTTSGVCSVILSHENSIYKGSQISTICDCCSVAMIASDILNGVMDTMNLIKSGINKLSEYLKKIHPLTTMGYNMAKFILGSQLTGSAAVANGLLSTMVFIQVTGTTYRDKMVDEKDWHAVMDTVTITRPGYLQSKKVYNIPNKKGGTDYIEVKINDDLTLDRSTAKYISEGKTKPLTEKETYKYFSEDYWTPFSMPTKYWDKSWK